MKKKINSVEVFKQTMERQGALFYSKGLLKQAGFIARIADADSPVLILGASGTGKELLAKAIHEMSSRTSKQFIPINCGGLNENTLLSELFGHTKDAFTGAHKDADGAIKRSDGGTLFLDEIGNIPMKAQIALLRFLNDGKYQRLGEIGKDYNANVRIICATNKDLSKEVKESRFREDLYFRLNVFPIQIPSLAPLNNDRASKAFRACLIDIVKDYDYTLKNPLFTNKAFEVLVKYSFPGNYREMRNILEYAIVKSGGNTIHPEHLPDYILGSTYKDNSNEFLSLPPDQFLSAVNKLIHEKFNQEYKERGSYLKAAYALGLTNTRFKRILESSREGKAI